MFLCGGVQLAARYVREGHCRCRPAGGGRSSSRRRAAERLLRQVRPTARRDQRRRAVDDDPMKQGRLLHGVPVVGQTADLPASPPSTVPASP